MTTTTTPKTLDAAKEYLKRGWRSIPAPIGSKKPVLINWPAFRLAEADLRKHFGCGPMNIGLLLGEPSGGLVDIDLDARESIALAPEFLPLTRMIHGRSSKKRSHYWYVADSPPRTTKFTDPEGAVLVEIRSTGSQTIVPPSLHPSGEAIAWEGECEPASVNDQELRQHVSTLAGCALLARNWKEGSRHDLALAIAGGLLRSGWSAKRTERFVAAAARGGSDQEWEARARDVRDTAGALGSGRLTTGWPKAIELLGTEVIDKLRDFLEIPHLSAPPGSDSLSMAAWPGPLGQEALHGLAGQIVTAIEPHTEADPVAILAQTLTAFGNIIGRNPYFQVEADRHHMNTFNVLVGVTSKGRKGTSWGQAKLPFTTVDGHWATERVNSGLSSGEGLIWAVRDKIERQDPIKSKGRVIDYETVIADPGVTDKRLLVLEPEFASVLQVLGREGSTLSPIVRLAYDTGILRTLTRNSPVVATGAHISIIGHITKDELLRNLDRTEMANGFANRFLWLAVRRSKLLPRGGRIQEVDFAPIVQALTAAVDFAKGVREMTRDEGAWEAWEQVYGELSDGRPGLFGAVMSRAEAQVTRLSCIYALLDRSSVVRREHIVAALALWEYSEASCRFIFGDSLGDPVADEILRALRSRPDGMTRTEIRDLFGRNKSAEQIGRALRSLAEQGLATMREEKTDGRSAERWFAIRPGITAGGTTKTTDTT